MERIRKLQFSTILFFFLNILSSLVYYFRVNPYVRPEMYFYLLALAVAVISYQILGLGTHKALFKVLIFFEIFLIAFSFTTTQQALYRTVLGRDPWTHEALVSQILKNTHIPHYENIKTPYVWMPNFHLLIISSMLIGNISYKWASFFSVGMITLVIELMVVYKLGKHIFKDDTIAIFASLFLAVSDNVLNMVGKNIIPNSIGVAVALLVFYLLLRSELKNKHKVLLVSLVVSLSLLHTISYSFMIIQTALILLISRVYGFHLQRKNTIVYLFSMMLIVAISVWGLISGFYLRVFIILVESLLKGINITRYTSSLIIPFKFVLLGRLGMILYFGISGIGILRYLYSETHRKTHRKQLNLTHLAVSANSMFFVGFGALAFLIWPWIASRFWYYGEVLGSFFVAYLLFGIYNSRDRKSIKKVLVIGVILIISWLMFVASISNDDNPLIKVYSTRTGWYDSELQAGLFILTHQDNIPIASDWDYIMNLNNLEWMKLKRLPPHPPKYGDIGWIIQAEFPQRFSDLFNSDTDNYMFILRVNLVRDYMFWLGPRWELRMNPPLGKGVYKLLSNVNSKKDICYNSGTVIIWWI